MPGYWAWAFLAPIGLLGYTVYSKKHAWMARIPLGIIVGLYAGQQIQIWWTQYGPQVADTMKPIFPTALDRFTVPAITPSMTQVQIQHIHSLVYPSQALSNLIFVVTVLATLSYFLFSFDVKHKAVQAASHAGRLLLMVGFGAIFGTTVMMRFTLLIDRMYFVFIEFLQHGVLHQ